MDIPSMAGRSHRIFYADAANSDRFCKSVLAYDRNSSMVWLVAEKSMEQESAPWGSNRIYRLVLERAAHLAKSASKYSVRCICKSSMFDRYLLYFEIFVERGI